MIYAVTGAPGSGKSFYTVRAIADALDSGKVVATNATLLPDWETRLARRNPIRRLIRGRVDQKVLTYQDRLHYTNDLAELMSIKLAGRGEGRGIAVLDEAHEWLNNRAWKDDDRASINAWFAEHRKRGWDVYLITQHIDSIDKQVRDRVEYHVHLRNMRNLRLAGIRVIPFALFLAIHEWKAGPRSKTHISKREVFPLDGRRRLYDSFALVHDDYDAGDDSSIWLPRSASPAKRVSAAGVPSVPA
jgi:adenosyl cobinamide kinase/adenosyl cobinamide phosphate guanylyltransferase